ncbi:MAG: DUF1858 domain-containing protein [Eubacteriaceae bacterium]|nr:DUF1858 domain-containing protein [Eubacteriaceae bacterium]
MAINKEMSITDCVSQFPETARIFMMFGMGCVGCAAATYESIEQGATVHELDVDILVDALNAIVA